MTVEVLIGTAARQGYLVTPRQVERWHKAGLLPRRRQLHLPGRRGSVGVYPAGTEAQFLALCRWRSKRRKLTELGFWLWWEGYDVPLRTVQTSLERVLPTVPRLSPARAFDAAEEGAEQLLHDPRFAPARRVRWRLRSEADALTALLTLLVAGLGGKPLWATGSEAQLDEASPQDLVFRGLGLDRAARDRVGIGEPWLPNTSEVVATAVGQLTRFGILPEPLGRAPLKEASVEQLEIAREDARILTEHLPTVIRTVQADYSRDAFGLGELRNLGQDGARDRAMMVVATLLLRRAGLSALLDQLLSSIRGAAPTAEVWLALHGAFPEYRPYLKRGGARLAELPEEAKERVGAFLEAYTTDHPELAGAMPP